MTPISDITKDGESETQEFKPAFNTDVIETAVAFANTHEERPRWVPHHLQGAP
jgi:predicted HTH transcriptional regulator